MTIGNTGNGGDADDKWWPPADTGDLADIGDGDGTGDDGDDGGDNLLVPRRRFAPDVGESLVLNRRAVDLVTRLQDFADFTGIPVDDLACSPLTAAPVPFTSRPDASPRDRWAGLAPEALWHPLLWLPSRLATPAGFDNHPAESGEAVQAWMVQTCLELEACGLYDPDQGWMDVLATAGLDIDDPDTVDRVAGWLAGDSDDILDRIDLADFFDPDGADPDWSAQAVRQSLPALQQAAIVVTADDLGSVCDALTDPDMEAMDSPESRQALDTVLLLADGHLPQVGPVAAVTPEFDGHYPDPGRWPTWQRLRDDLADGKPAWGIGSRAGAGFACLKQAYWPAIEQLEHQALL